MAFRSKVDWWLVLLVLAVPGWQIAAEWTRRVGGYPPASFWVLIAVLALMGVTLVPTRYVIEGRTVSIQCGLMAWEYAAFPVEDVLSVQPTHNPLASPALSLDRLKVRLRSGGDVLISPGDQKGFLRALSALDPQLRPDGRSLLRTA
jgi:hypothetical protein